MPSNLWTIPPWQQYPHCLHFSLWLLWHIKFTDIPQFAI